VTGENKSGVTSKAISVPKGPATIQGLGESFSTQASTGVAAFSIPFSLPRARGGAQPSLALSYSSASGSGVAGMGWDVAVPFIARQTDRDVPRYKDQDAWHPEQDRFVYNGGQELVPIADLVPGEGLPAWAAGWQYFRTRVEGSYLRFFWNRAKQLWRMQDKAGVVLELGGDANALETDPDDATRVFRWNLHRQLDAHGNEVRYSYLHDGGSAYLSDVYDTFPVAGGASASLSAWAHHAHLEYEARSDATFSYHRGWRASRSLRLSRVDVTSVTHEQSSARELVRRYHLGYEPGSHVSLLASVQLEGRCTTPVAEDASGALAPTACPRLPAMSFEYTRSSSLLADGFEGFDATVHSMAGSPKHSVDEDYTDLFDVDSDGLPDVVSMMPAAYGGKHALWLNGAGGIAGQFTAQGSIEVAGVLGATASAITKANPNLAALDLDGDATIDLLHMPKAKAYSVYTPRLLGGQWTWAGREVSTSDGLDARIDFGKDGLDIRVFDVNGDGLVDVVKSGGTSLEVWYALGRYPGGDGRFGSASFTGPSAAQLSAEPVLRCVPWAGQPIRFSDGDVKLADMNGDGLSDIVRVRQGDVKYWPGRGDGTFGTGALGCAGGSFSSSTFLQMSQSPWYADPNASALQLDDVNGDGLADLVQVRFDAVDVWLNVDGASWTERRILASMPPTPSYQSRVRLVDANGSGTRDLLWGNGGDYKYVDLLGGKRPWLLSRVANGLGKTTDIEYTSSTSEMLAAAKGGKAWSRRMPLVQQLVSRVLVHDNLGAVGRPEGVYVTEHRYRDPVYDGLQREFRGFGHVETTTLGDANSPSSVVATDFDLGERPKSFSLDSAPIDYTEPSNRWRDNPREALKGLPALTETRAAGAPVVYLSTVHPAYRLRRLYTGRDGRAVYAAFEERVDSYLYDAAGFVASNGSESLPAVAVQDRDSPVASTETESVPLRAVSGTKRTRSTVVQDVWGNRLGSTAYGVVGEDEAITTTTIPERIATPLEPLGDGKWSWRTVESWVAGSAKAQPRRHTRNHHDGHGAPSWTEAELGEVGSVYRPSGGPAGGLPETASQPGWIDTGHTYRDGFGNVVLETGPNSRCRAFEHGAQHAELAVKETIYAGEAMPATIAGQSVACGARALSATAGHDRGLQAPMVVVGVHGEVSTIRYDGFGRVLSVFAPDPEAPWAPSAVASLQAEYLLPDVTKKPYSILRTRTQDGLSANAPEYRDS
jgi:hypothetical protein